MTAALSSGSSEYDALHDRRIYDLDLWSRRLNRRPQRVHQGPGQDQSNYNWDDVLPGLRASTAWNGVPVASWARRCQAVVHPWGYELNNISYNQKMFDKVGVQPPKNLVVKWSRFRPSSPRICGPYGIGVRGSRSWASIHPGFLSGYANFGEKDFNVADGKLKAAMNSAGSKAFHKDW